MCTVTAAAQCRPLLHLPGERIVSLHILRHLRFRAAAGSFLFAALLTCVAISVVATPTCWRVLALAWVLAEAFFVPVFACLYLSLNRQPSPHCPVHDDGSGLGVFQRLVRDQDKLSRYMCVKDFISKWFWGEPYTKLSLDNLAELMAYGFLYKTRQQLEAEGQGDLPMRMAEELQRAWNLDLVKGVQYSAKPFMSHLWQPVRCTYRPLAFYSIMELLALYKHVLLLFCGFKSYKHKGFTVYTHGDLRNNVPGASNSAHPYLFLHGVGMGLLPYINFVHHLAATGRPIIALECKHLSMRLCTRVPEVDTIAQAATSFLSLHAVSKVHVIAHSYGTFTASRLAQRHSECVASLALLDPVCFLMFTGKLIYNFVYRSLLGGSKLTTWFVARHITHAASVSRRFYWSLLNLWCDQLPEHTLVVLAGQDELVPAQEVMTMLQHESKAHLLYHPEHRHASFLTDMAWQHEVCEQAALMALMAEQAHPTAFKVSLAGRTRSDSASSYDMLIRADKTL